MASFFIELWNSVFQPGTSPQLIIATHVSFVALLATLAWLIFVTGGNIHFIALFTIASLLWISVIWFIQELNNVKLKNNTELESEEAAKTTVPKEKQSSTSAASTATSSSSSSAASKPTARSRKA